MTRKAPVRLSALFAEPEQVELRDGRVVDVAPIDGIGFDLYESLKEETANLDLVWELTGRCLPSLTLEDVKQLRPAECAAVLAIATGQVDKVLELAATIQGNDQAPATTEPEPQSFSTPPDSSLPALQGSAG
jgi:hypothetical protein